MKNRQQGFTLVEIAIVLVIIGLLLGGILKGQEMITQAKIKNVPPRAGQGRRQRRRATATASSRAYITVRRRRTSRGCGGITCAAPASFRDRARRSPSMPSPA